MNHSVFLIEALKCIERLRVKGLENAKNTDIYTKEDLLELDEWYGTINKYLINCHLKNYVKTVVVIENRNSEIKSIHHIEYESIDEYYKNDREIEIVINIE